jgi:uncharacterized protein
VRIPVEDIKPFPTEVQFLENAQELNTTLSRGGEAECHLTAPLHVTLTHSRSGDDLLFSGTIQGEVAGQCARCLEDCHLQVSREFSVILSPVQTFSRELELSAEELAASFYSEDEIDLSALVHEQALLALPSQPLCREDCRGLCSQCGINLNLESCDCRPAWRDPRLAILSTLRLPSQGQ